MGSGGRSGGRTIDGGADGSGEAAELGERHDVVVVGGGAAGLSGALMLARARRSVVVVDAGSPRNAPADAVHGLLGREGMSPAELVEAGRDEVRSYGGRLISGRVTGACRDGDGFAVTVSDGRRVRARRLLVTSGLLDALPAVAGLAERWGRDVLHCPYCHGWEVRDRAIGVIATGSRSVQQALLLRQWTDDLMLFSHDQPTPSEEHAEQLIARGVPVVTGEVAALELAGDRVAGLRLADGTVVAREFVAVSPWLSAQAGFVAELGLTPMEHPSGLGVTLTCDATGRSEVHGVWVAGNVTDPVAQVGTAAAQGATAATYINADLVAEDTRRAVQELREPFSTAAEARQCAQVLGDRRHGL